MSRAGPYRLVSRPLAPFIEFSFDGRKFEGLRGDTVASALLANGVRCVARSFKFHRPRGIFTAGFEEPHGLVQLQSGARAIPSARATLIPLTSGLDVRSQSGWPAVRFDALRLIDFMHPLFAAGFYNKTFMWPGWGWYEPIIRKLAGFGRAPAGRDPDRYDTQHAHCDVLVIGGGSAGVEAAAHAGAQGQRVVLAETRPTFGADVSQLATHVHCLPRTTAVGYYDHELVALVESLAGERADVPRERLWLIRAQRVVLATGVIEQPLIFCNNDRPGIMLAGAALKYLRDHAVAPGRRVVIATNNDSAYAVAGELHRAGITVAALADSRSDPRRDLLAEMRAADILVRRASLPVDTRGFAALKEVSLGRLDSAGTAIMHIERHACDALLVSGGLSPALHLFAHAGGKLSFNAASRTFEPVAAHPAIEIVGAAATAPGGEVGPRVSPIGNRARQWVDLMHDVTVADVELAVRENYTNVEHVKRYTTLGMAADQGKVGQAPAAEVIARARKVGASEIGHTTFRPPLVPVTLGTLVGRHVGELYAPTRRTPLYALQAEAGALFDDFGDWRRAAAFPRAGESREEAMHGEVKLVRGGLGLYDASSLGKIELAGPDSLEFADRFYINDLRTLKPGRTRYGIMLRETGIVFDDGTIVGLDEDRLLLTTTSSGASRVAAWFEEWRQCEWPDLRVVVVPVTDQWATVALTGQHARAVLERLKPGCDVSNAAFPHLSMRVTRLLGAEARIYRVSFSGELTYEINVPADRGPDLWAALLDAGRDFGIAPYGVDALLHLRMEKGFIHVGADTDGTTVPDDIGFGKAAASKSRHYVGKRSLALPENLRRDRLQLIGLAGQGATPLPVGSHVRLAGSQEPTDGWVTSAGPLSTDRRPVGLAMLRGGRAQLDQVVTVHDGGRVVTTARVVAPSFYDPSGGRMHA
jgi:sarcosine oxidase subunit alpha